jgi:secreted trypsin-like serine protease
VLGNGDSGGPLVIEKMAAAAGGLVPGSLPFRACAGSGFYGQVVYNVRVSRYIDWIESIAVTRHFDCFSWSGRG